MTAWLVVMLAAACSPAAAQKPVPAASPSPWRGETAEDYNRRLRQLEQGLAGTAGNLSPGEYRIGAEDLLDISVFEAQELNRAVRVSASGEISLPLLGAIRAAGLTPRELESVLQELLRRTYMKDPHVAVFVKEMQSHSVSVFGAVKRPGVYQIRGAKTLVEVLSMAEGLAEDAGDSVVVMRRASVLPKATEPAAEKSPGLPTSPNSPGEPLSPPAVAPPPAPEPEGKDGIQIDLKNLIESGDVAYNILVYPGDVVKVPRAGVVYVVGEVRRPGGFVLKSNENISALQALALAEGLTRISAKSRARIIHTTETGERRETAIDLEKVFAGKAPDPLLQPRDILFVPGSAARGAMYRVTEAAISIASGVIVFRR